MSMHFNERKWSQSLAKDMTPFGAFAADDTVKFIVSASESIDIRSITMVIHGDGWGKEETVWQEYALHEKDGQFTLWLSMKQLCAEVGMEAHGGLAYYHYRICTNEETLMLGGEEIQVLTDIHQCIGERQLLVYDADYKLPGHWQEGVVYHIFVDRFAPSRYHDKYDWQKPDTDMEADWENGVPQYGAFPGAEVDNNVFFGGDLYGITENLSYIASLGVRTIYLSPVFDAASNHKYDTGDYLHVDRMFGGDKALAALCQKALEYNIRIILDGVFNHTGSDSLYFNKKGSYPSIGAWQSEKSPYAEWYTFQQFPDTYDCWWGVKILPRVNSENEGYRQFICNEVVTKWMQEGVYGWRLDVADELSDTFLNDFRQAVRRNNSEAVIIGEVWEDASDKVSYDKRRQYLRGRQLDGVMNYPLREGIIAYILYGDTEALKKATVGLYRRYPKWASDCQMNFLGTHDTIRILTALGGEAEGSHTNAELAHMRMSVEERAIARRRLITAYSLLAAMPGVPCVFYGDEAGLEGYRDPFCRRPFPWGHVDTELLTAYQTIGRIRATEVLLQDGVLQLLQADRELAVFARTPWNGENYQIWIPANRSDHRIKFTLPAKGYDLLTRTQHTAEVELSPGQVMYLRLPLL